MVSQCTSIGKRDTSKFRGENQQSHFDGGAQVVHIGKIVLRQHSCASSPASKIKLFSTTDIHASSMPPTTAEASTAINTLVTVASRYVCVCRRPVPVRSCGPASIATRQGTDSALYLSVSSLGIPVIHSFIRKYSKYQPLIPCSSRHRHQLATHLSLVVIFANGPEKPTFRASVPHVRRTSMNSESSGLQ